MKIAPNGYWWVTLALGCWVQGRTGSYLVLIVLAVVSVLQGLLLSAPQIRARVRAWHEWEQEH